MQKQSAGLLMFRRKDTELQVLLAHPGGPFWAKKDLGAWSIPKGEYTDEIPLEAAKREFFEETGFASSEPFLSLGEVVQTNNKRVTAWAFEGDCNPGSLVCNTFEMEWPPRSGNRQSFPEIDRVEWFDTVTAREKLLLAQVAFVDNLEKLILGGVVSIVNKNNQGLLF